MKHRYDVDRRTYIRDGVEMLSDYWRLVCRDCSFVGRRVDRPSPTESKRLLREFREHWETT